MLMAQYVENDVKKLLEKKQIYINELISKNKSGKFKRKSRIVLARENIKSAYDQVDQV